MEYINNLTISELIGILIFVESVVKVISIYFNKLYNYRHNTEKESEKVKELDQKLQKLTQQVQNNETENEVIIEVLKIQCRFYLVDSCLNSIHKGCIKSEKLQSIKDLYKVYQQIGGNSYVTDLVEHVDKIEIE